MEQSGKRHLLITGGRGAGKTTLLRALRAELPEMPALVTRAAPGREVRMDNGMASIPIGVFDPTLPGRENRMRPIRENLETAAASWLRELSRSAGGWAAVDEIGYLEGDCPGYCRALEELLEQKRVLAAVRKQQVPFLQKLLSREDACVVDLDEPFGRLGCVIMASGLGQRFGGNKLLAEFDGQSLIDRVLDATEGIFEKRVVVTRHEAVAELCRARSVPVILHDRPHRSDTVRLGIRWMGEDVDGCLFCPGDQPLLSRETVELMALCADGNHMQQLAFGDRVGTPVLFPRDLFGELKDLPQGKGGSVLVKKYPGRVQRVPAREEYELWDADTPEELERLTRCAPR